MMRGEGRRVDAAAALAIATVLFAAGPARSDVPPKAPIELKASGCVAERSDAAWLAQAMDKWRKAEVAYLALVAKPMPTMHVYDAKCAYQLPAGSFETATAAPHGSDGVKINGRTLPLGPIAFADGSGSFVMALPSVWRAKGVNGTFGLERLMDAVLLHEIMHTRQSELASAAFEPIERRKPAGVEISDDLIQDRFGKNADYVAAYERERDLLFAAAAANSDAEARKKAIEALGLIERRRARWFVGQDAYLSQVEDVFLTMEGMGQWMGYRMFLDLGVRPEAALKEVRRGGGYWSQDEGLAIMLIADRLSPQWKRQAFDPKSWGATTLLRAATAARSRS